MENVTPMTWGRLTLEIACSLLVLVLREIIHGSSNQEHLIKSTEGPRHMQEAWISDPNTLNRSIELHTPLPTML